MHAGGQEERHWERGEKYFAENKFKEAIQLGNIPSGLLLMSSVYLVENKLEAAIGEAKKAIQQGHRD